MVSIVGRYVSYGAIRHAVNAKSVANYSSVSCKFINIQILKDSLHTSLYYKPF